MRGGGTAPLLLTLALASLLGVTLTGCIFDPDDGLVEIFGSERVWGGHNDRVLHDVLVAQVIDDNGTGEWVREVHLDGTAPLVLEKSAPGPQGGGGETHDLPLFDLPSVEVRFDVDTDRLDNFTIRWTVDGVRVIRADETDEGSFILQPRNAGMYEVGAVLLRDDSEVARTYQGIRIFVTGTWSIESSIYPLRLEGSPEPTNYDAMRDLFLLDVRTSGMTLSLETMFRGTYDPLRDGTDVDLGLHDGSGQAIECVGTGGNSPVVPDPAAAEENIVASVSNGTHNIHVGALRSDCSGSTWYHNQGPVPYRLIVVADPTG